MVSDIDRVGPRSIFEFREDSNTMMPLQEDFQTKMKVIYKKASFRQNKCLLMTGIHFHKYR